MYSNRGITWKFGEIAESQGPPRHSEWYSVLTRFPTSQMVPVVKKPAPPHPTPAKEGDTRDMGSEDSGLERFPGVGSGNLLQYSFQENPMDRGTWWATAHRVAKSQTWLKQSKQISKPLNLYAPKGLKWRRKWQLTPVFLPGEVHGQRSLAGYSPWDCKELDTNERLSLTEGLRGSVHLAEASLIRIQLSTLSEQDIISCPGINW